MTSGAGTAARVTPSGPIEGFGDRRRRARRLAAGAPGGFTDAGRPPRAVRLPTSDELRRLDRPDQAVAAGPQATAPSGPPAAPAAPHLTPAAAAGVSERYLAPALNAAAAARARSARIRAATQGRRRRAPPGVARPATHVARAGWCPRRAAPAAGR